MESIEINILNLLLLLLAAWVGGNAARRIGYPAILGELLIGIILGPGILGLIGTSVVVKVLSEVGIILLMVYIGMEIDFRDLKKASWAGLLAAAGGFIVPFVLGYWAVVAFGGNNMSALFVAIAVGVTSLATKSRILVDLRLLDTRIAYVLMAGALISDTLALLIFAGIISLAEAGSFDIGQLLLVGGKALAFFAVTIGIGIYILPRLGQALAKYKFANSTFYFTVILIVGFGYSELAELAGMHNILGAFMAGLFIKDNLFPKNISKEVHKAFYDVSIGFMAPIFFVSAGFFVDINVFQTDLVLLLTIVGLAIIGKIVGTALFYLPSGNGWREGITVGAGMNGRGAVEIIIAGIGLEMGIIDNAIFSILVFMAIFTTMTVPVLLKWTTSWLRKRGELVRVSKRSGIIILGVNSVSLLIAKLLRNKTSVTFIDNNAEAVSLAQSNGFLCHRGNALKEDVLQEGKANLVAAFIGFTANSEVNMLAAQLARESFLVPQTFIVVSEGEDGVGADMLETMRISSLFAMRVKLTDWLSRIDSNETVQVVEVINAEVTTRQWVKNMKATGRTFLPLVINCKNGHSKPFRYDDVIEPGEEIVYLFAQTS